MRELMTDELYGLCHVTTAVKCSHRSGKVLKNKKKIKFQACKSPKLAIGLE